MKRKFPDSFRIIKKAGLSSTKSRIVVFDILSCDEHYHSIPEIIKKAKEDHDIDLNTKSVYNAINDFTAKGLIEETTIKGVLCFGVKHNLQNIHVIDGKKISHIKVSEEFISEITRNIDPSKKIQEIHIKIK